MVERPDERSDALVFFGATGDLVFKKIFPALEAMVRHGKLDCPVIGVARSAWSLEQFKARAKASLSARRQGFDGAAYEKLASLLRYVQGDYQAPNTYAKLRQELGAARRPLHYLAIPPSLFDHVAAGLASSGCDRGARLVVEKPFGRSLATAQALNATLHGYFPEESIFRIDHFLGKEPVQNLLYFRFANPQSEALWTHEYIESVQITMAESFGVAGRGSFYEETGALRDVVQNHLLEVVASLAMEYPSDSSQHALRSERARLLAAIEPLTPSQIVRGQCREYRHESGVAPNSHVETFAAVRLHIATARWAGVPFYLRAGKYLAVTATEVLVRLKPGHPSLFDASAESAANNYRFRLSPGVEVAMGVMVKAPGEAMVGQATELVACRRADEGQDPYERLLGDAMRGDPTLFAREDGVEAAWRVIDPILQVPTPLYGYEAGSWGPAEAKQQLQPAGGWHNPQSEDLCGDKAPASTQPRKQRMQNQSKLEFWHELAAQLRVDSIRCTTAAGSGHPSSSLSAADLMAVLLAKYLAYDFDAPARLDNDRLIFSKGHASPLLYAMYHAAGAIKQDELLSLRRLNSRLQGHPSPRALPWVDVATGSLGQGLAVGVGMALCAKRVVDSPMRSWVLLGDSEMAEGSVWEAFDKAAYYKLDNLIAILDMNRLGQQSETAWGWNSAVYAARAKAFGWQVIEVDGHDLAQIDNALGKASQGGQGPTCVIAKTVKGQGVSFLADHEGWHGKALSDEEAQKAIAELGGKRTLSVRVQRPSDAVREERASAQKASAASQARSSLKASTYEAGSSVATRRAYGDALVALGKARLDVVVLDAEVSNSTYSDEFKKVIPERFFEMFIAEQQMVSAASGFAVLGQCPFVSSFACFLTRAFDQIRMAAISGTRLCICGSHAGISIGEDGPSQMGLEDLAMMRAVFGSTVLYPSDAVQTAALVAEMADCQGIVYLRTTRAKTPLIYSAHERFPLGGSKVLRTSQHDQVTLVAAGITVHEALQACDALQRQGVACRLIDAYSVKPIDQQTLHESLVATEGRLVVVEDHWREGGLGAAVLEAVASVGVKQLRLKHLAVGLMPGSGTPAELLRVAGIDAQAITEAVLELCSLSPVEAAS